MLVKQTVFIRSVLLAILVVSIIAACTGRETETTATATTTETETIAAVETDTSTATAPASPGGTALVPSATAGTTVDVLLMDGRLEIPTRAIPVGPAVFTVTNSGTEVHNLQIDGNNTSNTLPGPLDKNARNTLSVELVQGTYNVFCPLPGHKEKGETLTLTIPMQ